MVRRAVLVVAGSVLALAAGACGDDSSGSPSNTAGTAADAGQAGSPADAPQNDGGAAAGQPAAEAGASVGGSSGVAGDATGESGASAQASPDVVGQIFAGSSPVAGAVVALDGVVTLADAEGKFALRRVAPTYQLMVRMPGEKLVVVYEGVETRAPRVNLLPYTAPAEHSAKVRGVLVGVPDPEPDDARKVVGFVGKGLGFSDSDSSFPVASYELTPQWSGSATNEGEVWALVYAKNFQKGLYDYLSFGKKSVHFAADEELGSPDGSADTNVTLSDVDEVALDTSVTMPAGWDVNYTPSLQVGPLTLFIDLPLGAGELLVPKLDAPVLLLSYGSDSEGKSTSFVQSLISSDATDALLIAHQPPATLTSPDDRATGIVRGSEFFWDDMPAKSVATLNVAVGDFNIYVHTASGSARLPNLDPLHIAVPGQISGKWSVTVSGPATTIEEAMALDDGMNRSAPVAGFVTTSRERDFVTGN